MGPKKCFIITTQHRYNQCLWLLSPQHCTNVMLIWVMHAISKEKLQLHNLHVCNKTTETTWLALWVQNSHPLSHRFSHRFQDNVSVSPKLLILYLHTATEYWGCSFNTLRNISQTETQTYTSCSSPLCLSVVVALLFLVVFCFSAVVLWWIVGGRWWTNVQEVTTTWFLLSNSSHSTRSKHLVGKIMMSLEFVFEPNLNAESLWLFLSCSNCAGHELRWGNIILWNHAGS